MKILYVDDDEDDRELFRQAIFEIDPDINYAEARSGEEAFRFLEASREIPDYIFLDINMPRMSGMDFLLHLKARRHYSAIQVVMFSTSGDPQDHEKATLLGARQYVVKPSSFNKICQIVKVALSV